MFFSESVDTLILTNNIQWSDLSLCMVWHLRGQDIHRHSEDQIHMHDTQIIVLIRVQMECWDLLTKRISIWVISTRSGDDIHRHSEDHIHILETGTKMNINKNIYKIYIKNTLYTVILTKQMQVKSSVSVDGLALTLKSFYLVCKHISSGTFTLEFLYTFTKVQHTWMKIF